MTSLYVGNLPGDMDEEGLRALFSRHGQVTGASLVMDPDSGRSRGFGFVEMSETEAQAAMDDLDGLPVAEIGGGEGLLRVNVARERGAKPPRRAY